MSPYLRGMAAGLPRLVYTTGTEDALTRADSVASSVEEPSQRMQSGGPVD